MTFSVPPAREAEVDELLSRYPQKRSAALMVLHALQEEFGHVSREAVEWTAAKVGVQPIQIQELVTFYPMFRQEPAGRHQFKVCRTLSCALGGGHALHDHLCRKFGLDAHRHGLQTTADGNFSVEFVECLAGCGSAPVVMVNEALHEAVTAEQLDQLVAALHGGGAQGHPAKAPAGSGSSNGGGKRA